MKLTTIALAFVLALPSTSALAYTAYHRTHGYHHYHYSHNYHGNRGSVGLSYPYRGSPNNRGGLVGGDDPGTYKP
jgi:hypothetical protein